MSAIAGTRSPDTPPAPSRSSAASSSKSLWTWRGSKPTSRCPERRRPAPASSDNSCTSNSPRATPWWLRPLTGSADATARRCGRSTTCSAAESGCGPWPTARSSGRSTWTPPPTLLGRRAWSWAGCGVSPTSSYVNFGIFCGFVAGAARGPANNHSVCWLFLRR